MYQDIPITNEGYQAKVSPAEKYPANLCHVDNCTFVTVLSYHIEYNSNIHQSVSAGSTSTGFPNLYLTLNLIKRKRI